MSAGIIASGAISALGEGASAASAGQPGSPAQVALKRDAELAAAGLARPHAARAVLDAPRLVDRASVLLARAAASCCAELDRELPRWRELRVGLAVGTSSGGMRSAERVFSGGEGGLAELTPEEVAQAFYFAPLLHTAAALQVRFAPATLVLGACAAASLAIGLGARWLEARRCDVVLAGGFDAVSVLVAAGFEALRATTAELPPRPFRLGRDGMALGEGAALLALVPSEKAGAARAHVTGFGASSDAVHLTAPDRTGGGLARAARAALDEAARPRVDLVSAHATATPFSDAAEAMAIREALGRERAAEVVVHPFKAQIGHTLGASGALEALVCVDAIERGVLPASAGAGTIDPDAEVRLLERCERGAPEVAVKLSAAFGGANAALVIARRPPPRARAKPLAEAYVTRATHVPSEPGAAALSTELGQPIERIARADGLTRLALAAVLGLAKQVGSLQGAGIVVGETFATLETDATFHARIVERGARMAEPRRFPYTSPNAVAGECGVTFGLTGPSFAVGAGPAAGLEALAVAADLVRAGDAERVVVVAADQVGRSVSAIAGRLGISGQAGAVAVLVQPRLVGAAWRVSDTRLELVPDGPPAHGVGHTALLGLTEPGGGDRVLSAGGRLVPGAWSLEASARLVPV